MHIKYPLVQGQCDKYFLLKSVTDKFYHSQIEITLYLYAYLVRKQTKKRAQG